MHVCVAPVKESGLGCGCRDIDPNDARRRFRKKEHFSTSRKQMARDTGPPTSPTTSRLENEQPGRSCKLKKHASLFALWPPPRSGTSIAAVRSLSRSQRCPLPELLYAAFEVNVHLLLRPSLFELPTSENSALTVCDSHQ